LKIKGKLKEAYTQHPVPSEYACREFSIERSAKAFLDAIEKVQAGQA